jgi:integrase
MKLEELLTLYQKEKPQLSPRTIQKYKSIITMFARDAEINNIYINRNKCIKWRNKILERSSAGNCNNYHRHMKSLFNFAVKEGYLDINVFQSIQMLKTSKAKCRTINQATIEKLVEIIKVDNYYSQHAWFYLAMIDTFRFTGIRRRQLIGIKWCDIDFNNKTLYLNSEFSKNGNDNLVPINKDLIHHFIAIKNKSKNPKQSEQVFNITKFVNNYKETQMNEAHVSSLFVKWSNKINAPVSAHRFRHTVATKIANSGLSLKSLQQLLGHSDIRTTMGYVETNLDDLRIIQLALE